MYRIGFDVGGTFTDFTLHDTAGGMLRHFKVPSTPADPSEAIEGGLRMLLDTLHTTPGEISCLGHSTTIATNMVIESRGVAAGCIMTMGFHDSSGDRPSVAAASLRLHRVHAGAAAPRVPPGGVGTHRCGGAVLQPLDETEVVAAADALAAQGVAATVVCFLPGYLNATGRCRSGRIGGVCRPGGPVLDCAR